MTSVCRCCCCHAGEYKYGWHALPRAFTRGETRIISGRASCEYGIRRRSIDAYNVSVQKRSPPPCQSDASCDSYAQNLHIRSYLRAGCHAHLCLLVLLCVPAAARMLSCRPLSVARSTCSATAAWRSPASTPAATSPHPPATATATRQAATCRHTSQQLQQPVASAGSVPPVSMATT
jgi:hypothetical protein